MGPAFDRWLSALSEFQMRRGIGQAEHPWEELQRLEDMIDPLTLEGLDSRSAAACLLDLERAGLRCEQREFGEALQLAASAEPTLPLVGPVRQLIVCNRALIMGNVYLVRDGNAPLAADFFRTAIQESVDKTMLIRGNAAINLGICHSLMGQDKFALESYQLALQSYEFAQRVDKVAVAVHSLGNAYRSCDEFSKAARLLTDAMTLYQALADHVGGWAAADDLARTYLCIGDERPHEREQWIHQASQASDVACFLGTQVWNATSEEGRLADLSDQMTNHTSTRCEIAILREDPIDFMGTLALMKGRIRFSRLAMPMPANAVDEELRAALASGAPAAYFDAVSGALQSLSDGKTIALLEQFAVADCQLMMTYAILSPTERYLGGFHAGLPSPSEYNASRDLRGRARGGLLTEMCARLVESISKHGQRCSMVVSGDGSAVSDTTKSQLRQWADELHQPLRELGELFFPSDVLHEFRRRNVEHVILCIDPLLARVPYTAIQSDQGPILDEPWSLSLLTASTELLRVLERRLKRGTIPNSLSWFAPDKEVNDRLGGNEECERLQQLANIKEVREQDATVDCLISTLNSGGWCHFRGHGHWTGVVETSGPVLWGSEKLTSTQYTRISVQPGFLFTAACLTGFGQSVGTELFGSLVDYDRAGLSGAVLTSWPIHGNAATLNTSIFYAQLKANNDAAKALKTSSWEVRNALPHPYFWAPFALIGDWHVGGMIDWLAQP